MVFVLIKFSVFSASGLNQKLGIPKNTNDKLSSVSAREGTSFTLLEKQLVLLCHPISPDLKQYCTMESLARPTS